jgi:hypothetical protein
MPLPHGSQAVLDLRKLEDYCLDVSHPRGRHKARVFRQVFGIGRSDASWLRDVLLAGAATEEALRMAEDRFGVRWRIDIRAERQGRSAVIRSVWIVRADEAGPKFVTCWVL